MTVTDTLCVFSTIQDVVVNPPPDLSFSSTDATCGLSDGSATVTATGGSGSYTYLWDSNTGGQTTQTANNLSAGNYFVTVSDGYCSTASFASIYDVNAPVVALTADTTVLCAGQSAQLNVSGGNSYLWSSSQTTPSITVTPSDDETFFVTVTDVNGCSATDSITISVFDIPVPGFTYDILGNGLVQFNDTSSGATAWLWLFGDGGYDYSQNPLYTYITEGTYNVIQVVQNLCGIDSSIQVILITKLTSSEIVSSLMELFPNPNNGIFNLKFNPPFNMPFSVKIFSILGEQVYSREFEQANAVAVITLNLQHLTKGVYQISVSDNENIFTRKLIIGLPGK